MWCASGSKPEAKRREKPVMVFSEIYRLCSAVGFEPTATRKQVNPSKGLKKVAETIK
jgi:hypothetical protein